MNRLFIQPATNAEEEFYIKRAFYCPEEEREDVTVCNGRFTVAAAAAERDDKGNISLLFYESRKDAESGECPLSAKNLLKKEGAFSDITEEEAGKTAEIFGRLSAALYYGRTMYTQDMFENKTETMTAVIKITAEIEDFVHSIDLPFVPSISESFEKGYKTERLRCKKENYAAGLEAEYLYSGNEEEEPER